MKLALVLLLLAAPLHAQRMDAGELGGGAAYNLALRIPLHVAPKPWRGIVPRLALFTLGSLAYEVFVDRGHMMTDSVGRWSSTGQQRADIEGREVGYLVMEALVQLWRHR